MASQSTQLRLIHNPSSLLTSTIPKGPRTTHSSSSNHPTTISISISKSSILIIMIYWKAIHNLCNLPMFRLPINQLTISRGLHPTVITMHTHTHTHTHTHIDTHTHTYKHSYELNLKWASNMLGQRTKHETWMHLDMVVRERKHAQYVIQMLCPKLLHKHNSTE